MDVDSVLSTLTKAERNTKARPSDRDDKILKVRKEWYDKTGVNLKDVLELYFLYYSF